MVARLALVVAALAVAQPAAAAVRPVSRTYASGDLSQTISGVGSSGLRVAESGPLSSVRVGLRLRSSDLGSVSVRLVAPNGRVAELVPRGSATGSELGGGSPDCHGSLASYEARGLERLDAAGRWRLVVDDDRGAGAKLLCWTLTLTRRADVAASGGVRAELTWRSDFTNVRLTVFRGGSIAFAGPLRPVCRGCDVLPGGLTVRDLGGGPTPEIVVWASTGGAHCCAVAYLFRLVPGGARVATKSFGNPGVVLRVVAGAPLFVSGDDRFAYAFTSFAASSWPLQIWRWRLTGFADVTRAYPMLVEADAARQSALLRRAIRTHADTRGVAAAWAADEALVGRAAAARDELDALARERSFPAVGGGPANATFVSRLWRFLERLRYV